MTLDDDEFTKALFVGTRFGNEKLNQIGYRSFWHHPSIITEKGIQTPDGVLHNKTFKNSIIAEYKGHRSSTNIGKRVKTDLKRIEKYQAINSEALNKVLPINSNTQDLLWFWNKSWKEGAGKDYFKEINKSLSNFGVREWNVEMLKNQAIEFNHLKTGHHDKNLNKNQFIIQRHKRSKCTVISRETNISEYLDAVYFALLTLAAKGEPSFSLDNIFTILEANYYICESKNTEFRKRMRTTVNEFVQKKNFTGVLNPTETRKAETWSFRFKVELGRDERRTKRIEQTYEKIKAKYMSAMF